MRQHCRSSQKLTCSRRWHDARLVSQFSRNRPRFDEFSSVFWRGVLDTVLLFGPLGPRSSSSSSDRQIIVQERRAQQRDPTAVFDSAVLECNVPRHLFFAGSRPPACLRRFGASILVMLTATVTPGCSCGRGGSRRCFSVNASSCLPTRGA